jgi:hypothetical protein
MMKPLGNLHVSLMAAFATSTGDSSISLKDAYGEKF